jgi:hypothetical protein
MLLRAGIHPLYARRLVLRALLFWGGARLAVTGLGAAADVPPGALGPRAALLLAGMVAVLAHVDARAMREQTFHANLGTPRWAGAATAALLVLLLESVVAALAR